MLSHYGKSAGRILADLARWTGDPDLLKMSPIDASKVTPVKALNEFLRVDVAPFPESHDTKTVMRFVCRQTRTHLEVSVDGHRRAELYDFHYLQDEPSGSKEATPVFSETQKGPDEMDTATPEPPSEDPLAEDAEVDPDVSPQFHERTYVYVCANTGIRLTLTLRPPEFSPQDLQPYTPQAVRQRFKETEHLRQSSEPSPASCLHTLFKIIDEPLNRGGNKEIRFDNAAIQQKIDQRILASFHFTRDEDKGTWTPPKLYETQNPFTASIRAKLERKMAELYVLIRNSSKERDHLSSLQIDVTPLEPEVRSVLKLQPENRGPLLLPRAYAQYVTLGVTENDSDDALISAYERLSGADRVLAPYYFEALREAAQQRESEFLIMKVMELMSLGCASLDDVRAAFVKFGLDMDEAEHMEPEHIAAQVASFYDEQVDQGAAVGPLRMAMETVASITSCGPLQEFIQLTANDVDLPTAYADLGVEPAVDDDVIITAYEFAQSENTSQRLERAFKAIAIDRQAPLLLSFVEKLVPDIISEQEACQVLGVSPSASPDDAIAAFRGFSDKRRIVSARKALRFLGNMHDSDAIIAELSRDPRSAVQLPQSTYDWPIGLNNIGNTCYLNSLLQYYFAIKPLREEVLQHDGSTGDDDLKLTSGEIRDKRIGGRSVSLKEVKRAQEFIHELALLFNDMIYSNQGYVTPRKNLAYLALVSASQEDEHAETEKGPENEVISEGRCISDSCAAAPGEGDKEKSVDTDSTLVQSPATADPESNPEYKAERINETLFGRQQDVTECIENVLFQLEAAVKGDAVDADGEQDDLVKRLFYGQTKQVLQPVNTNDTSKRREKTERFLSLLVDVADGPRDLYDALDSYFGHDLVSLSDGDVIRSLTIGKLPPMLQIQVQRVQFDRDLGRPFKSLAVLKFDEVVYMDRYIDTDDEEVNAKRMEVFKWREQRRKLIKELDGFNAKVENSGTLTDNLKLTEQWLMTLPSDVSKVLNLVREEIVSRVSRQEAVEAELADLDSKIQSQFAHMKQIGYKIHAVFIHRGEASFGHYWTYIRDHQGGFFRKYNDEKITRVDDSEVMDFDDKNTATPYFLVFVREDLIDSMVEPLYRIERVVEEEKDDLIDVDGDGEEKVEEVDETEKIVSDEGVGEEQTVETVTETQPEAAAEKQPAEEDPSGLQHFNDTFDTYILTKECGRSFDHISSIIPRGIILADDVTACEDKVSADRWSTQEAQIHFDELGYTKKYQQALDLCSQGRKEKCLVIEDDVVFINGASSLFQRIRFHMLFFSGPQWAYDCSSVGLGWLKTGQTSNKSLCRIVDSRSAPCLSSEMSKKELAADLALGRAQEMCGVSQHRFLLVQHTGYRTIIRASVLGD
ncbi:Ubiquitin carboxyl-terminal hydrolase 2 [Yarrowia sp. B02]|nr:Ubiquitin carboxyl-terminal hydrolase 2 [Yarrowia sp. B02]